MSSGHGEIRLRLSDTVQRCFQHCLTTLKADSSRVGQEIDNQVDIYAFFIDVLL